MRKGKESRNTDSQIAFKIDVNKASKLWSAFGKIGWLEEFSSGMLETLAMP